MTTPTGSGQQVRSGIPPRLWGRPAVLGGLGLALLLLGPGCAQQYRITLGNGDTIVTQGRPKLDHGYYIYKDANGQEQRLNQMRVRAIEAQ